uniref:RNA-dependent RNA polymerase n=1 Tax=Plasmopara viticola lesion associated mitovirus 44 TaxID=2719472 RepID=A0A6G9RTB6_9VIRU|nr:RNA-dependent RNA polymerase [Plasmopara viticola lesion associated mitovirus 44]
MIFLMFNYFKTSQRPKISSKAWISKREIRVFFKEVIWVSQLSILKDSLSVLQKRISKMVDNSGFQFTFKYLKTVLHITVRFLSGRPLLTYSPKGIPYVSIDSHGLPKIIPLEIRRFLKGSDLSKDSKIIGAILSVLSIFRVFPTHVAPKLDTIVSKFSGSITSFHSDTLKAACVDLFSKNLINRKPRFDCKVIGGESAGPNGFKAAWSSGIDALAFIHNPKLLYFISLWYWRYSKTLLIWLYFLIVVGIIPYTILFVFSHQLRSNPLIAGKLSVVYNVAGKARVIAITNWWIQAAFKPLHDDLFSLLKTLPQDGTFDQDKPLDILLSKDISSQIYSFDLSAATDRLPLDIQQDILNIIYSDNIGDLWSSILRSISWRYDGKDIKYSVGQPMGAYSSWAMLAVTHHIITRLASLEANISKFEDYCVLGDDFVIRNDEVAIQYQAIMRLLGVEINLDKSVISDKFSEFAKRLKGPNINISPIGPGLILRFIRDKFYIGSLISEAIKLKWFRSIDDVLNPVLERFPRKANILALTLWICSGAGGAFARRLNGTDHPLTDRIIPVYFGRHINPDNISVLNGLISSIGLAFTKQIRWDLQQQRKQLNKEIEFLYNFKLHKLFVTRLTSTMILESLLIGISPGLYYYLSKIDKASNELDQKFDVLNRGFSDWDSISDLIRMDSSINFSTVDWCNRSAVKKIGEKSKTLVSLMQKSWDIHNPPLVRGNKQVRELAERKRFNRINIAIF